MRRRCLITVLAAVFIVLGMLPAQARPALETVSTDGVRFDYDPAFASRVVIERFAGDPPDADQPGGPRVPALRFELQSGPSADWGYETRMTVQVFRLAALVDYPFALEQANLLRKLLTNRPDLEAYANNARGGQQPEMDIPYLPVIPATAVVRARARYIETRVLEGVAYITAFRQDVSPFVASDFEYTFQGLSKDGRFYVSISLPVTAPGFPAGAPIIEDYAAFSADYLQYLDVSIALLEAAEAEAFDPALTHLRTALDSLELAAAPVASPHIII